MRRKSIAIRKCRNKKTSNTSKQNLNVSNSIDSLEENALIDFNLPQVSQKRKIESHSSKQLTSDDDSDFALNH